MPMTPDHKTETLDGLIAQWRTRHAGYFNRGQFLACADELAPILAGLREFRETLFYRKDKEALDALLGQPATADQTAYGLSKSQDKRLKAQGKPADQKGAGKETK